MNQIEKNVRTTVRLNYTLRRRLDRLRMARAAESRSLPPSVNDVLVEALERLISQEAAERRAARAH